MAILETVTERNNVYSGDKDEIIEYRLTPCHIRGSMQPNQSKRVTLLYDSRLPEGSDNVDWLLTGCVQWSEELVLTSQTALPSIAACVADGIRIYYAHIIDVVLIRRQIDGRLPRGAERASEVIRSP
ncbi:hypothetical protein An05g01390 [Aspergillus niger]|uniref:Uncharacterized protein n=2 Tax=Aspergillus niger TaxID=5061 RepID=A2QKU1_ASPNC|nr:hypothetical protein An05g01390 [Aspergillus niger]CAK96478.1 hypothetical protein An05g01390 [Aspergillus niger]